MGMPFCHHHPSSESFLDVVYVAPLMSHTSMACCWFDLGVFDLCPRQSKFYPQGAGGIHWMFPCVYIETY